MKIRAAVLAAVLLVVPGPSAASDLTLHRGVKALRPVLQLITRAKKTLDVELFLLSDRRVLRALEDAASRGVEIRLLLEASNRSNRKSAGKLKHKRIKVRWHQAKNKARLHARAACADHQRLMVGSADWTPVSLVRDVETSVVISSADTCLEWTQAFDRSWDKAGQELPRRWALEDELESLPDPRGDDGSGPKLNLAPGKE